MPDRCYKCGIAALESQQFVEENFPFMRRRFYCPACHQRLVHRVLIAFILAGLAVSVVAIIAAVRTNERVLDHFGFSLLFLLISQWVLIIPHELGHAVAAHTIGYSQIRILIGGGRPLFSFEFGGFYWVLNPIPFGGLTFAKTPAEPKRWKEFIFVSGGLAVNAAIAVAAWFCTGPGGLFYSAGSIAKLVFWANVVVVVENLIPRAVQTSYGNTFTDGWQIWHVLFHWNKPPTTNPKTIPVWEVVTSQILKWAVVLILFLGALFFAWVASVPLLKSFGSITTMSLAGKGLWSVSFFAMALVCGWYCWRFFRQPVAKIRNPPATIKRRVDFRSRLNTEQLEILEHASKLLKGNQFAEAATLLDCLLAAIADQNSDSYCQLLLAKVRCHLNLQEIDKAEALCVEYAQLGVAREQKLKVLDGAASYILYQPSSPFLKQAERLARLALEVAPRTLTLRGTLGALLAEQGNYSEAGPLLEECLELSPALHDRAIATFYLGLIKMRAGKAKEGSRLMKRGMKMYPEAWIVAKGSALLKEA